ncbi:MAG: hypothetical protein IJG37_06480 [Synergistaceae bacterium]|nr:hypothetical protein [Synergistaceae bacterium]
MTEAVFALFVASGLCLTFTAITAVYAIRTLEKSRQFLYFAWDLLHRNEAHEVYRKEGTE